MEIPCWGRLQLCLAESMFSMRSCEPVGDPHCSSLFLKHCTPWKGPCWISLWRAPAHGAGPTLMKYVEKFLHRWHSMLKLEKSMRGKKHLRQLAISWAQPPLLHPRVRLRKRRQRNCECDHGKNRGVAGWTMLFFFNWCCFSSSYSTFNGKKKTTQKNPKWSL